MLLKERWLDNIREDMKDHQMTENVAEYQSASGTIRGSKTNYMIFRSKGKSYNRNNTQQQYKNVCSGLCTCIGHFILHVFINILCINIIESKWANSYYSQLHKLRLRLENKAIRIISNTEYSGHTRALYSNFYNNDNIERNRYCCWL